MLNSINSLKRTQAKDGDGADNNLKTKKKLKGKLYQLNVQIKENIEYQNLKVKALDHTSKVYEKGGERATKNYEITEKKHIFKLQAQMKRISCQWNRHDVQKIIEENFPRLRI